VEKFIGIALIMAASIQYSRNAGFAKLLAPLVRIGSLPMIAYAKVSCALIGVILWPFKQVLALFQKPSPQSGA